MRKLFAFLGIVGFSGLAAQDTLVKMDSSRVVVKVVSVTDRKITYTRYDNPQGATYETSRNNVARIAYANGTQDIFEGRTETEIVAGKKPNVISITTTDLIAGVITLNYERIIGSDIGIRLIGSMGVLGTTGKVPDYYGSSHYYSRYKLFSVGTDMHYYVFKGSRISYYTGALIEYGQVRELNYWWEWGPPPNASRITEYYFGGLTNGLSIHASHNVNMDMFCSLGWRHNMTQGYSDYAARFGFSIGYQF